MVPLPVSYAAYAFLIPLLIQMAHWKTGLRDLCTIIVERKAALFVRKLPQAYEYQRELLKAEEAHFLCMEESENNALVRMGCACRGSYGWVQVQCFVCMV